MSKGPQEVLDHVPQTDAQWELWVISPPTERPDDDEDAPVLTILFDRSAETVRDVVEMSTPISLDAVVDVVVEAMVHPKTPGAPMRPRRLVVYDAPLHAPLGLALSAFGVDIVAGDERKVDFKALAAQLTSQLPPIPHGLFTNAPHRERDLCAAARDFLNVQGWRALRPWDVLKLTPLDDDALHHPIVTIRAWEPLGVVMNRTAQEARDFYNDATHVGDDPLFAEQYDVLWLLFTLLEDIPEEAHEALADSDLLTSDGQVPRFYHIGGQQPDDAPGPRASNHLITSLKALTAFFARHQPIDEQGLMPVEDTINVDGLEIHIATRPDLCLDPD